MRHFDCCKSVPQYILINILPNNTELFFCRIRVYAQAYLFVNNDLYVCQCRVFIIDLK